MKWLLCILALILCGICSKADQDWWKHAVFYQIYPRSFKDSDGDGVGDIRGIISKVDHFKDAGIDAILLSSIYESPQVDQGYDVSDFKAIDKRFGTMEDFEELLEKAHDLEIKVIMDFIPNHTSDQHEWFVKSENSEDGYEEYYVWRDKPNNWTNCYNDSAWTYSTKRQQYYYHQYTSQQPDLNYRNKLVVAEIEEILTFWLDVGVDGFRMVAVAYLFEDADATEGAIYTKHLPETLNMVHQFRELVDDYTQTHGGDSRVIMTEVYEDIEGTLKYYGTKDGSELRAHFTFNFQLITKLNSNPTATHVVSAINEWLDQMPLHYTANWVLGNRDNHRVASRLGPKNVDGFNMLNALLPGIQITYNGEEVGQENGDIAFEYGQDPIACKNNETFLEVSRDFERTPFHWDETKNAGFSDADETWLPVSEKYLEINLGSQSINGVDSHYHVYQDLVKLRKQPTFVEGNVKLVAASENVIGFSRFLHGHDTYVCLFNMGDTSEILNLNAVFDFSYVYFEVLVASVDSTFKKGLLYNATNVELNPHESIVVKIITAVDQNWWKNAVIYQVYARSFKDSDNDGIGDLKGIANKIQHFQNTGVDAILLSPIFKTAEGYYDDYISDYKQIDAVYGTMKDFEELVNTLHTLGIKLIMEFVPNHSSSEHEWFELSESKTEGYEDFYVWKDPVDGNEPNNWLSTDGGSAWAWSEKRRQYYYHYFTPEQPDLNYRSAALVQEIKDILVFWLDKGVDGFAMDSASLLFENEEFKNDLKQTYTENQPETYAMIYQFRELFDNYSHCHGGDARVLITIVKADVDKTMLYYGAKDGSKLGAHFSFNYQLIQNLNSSLSAKNYVDAINTWVDYMPLQHTANWILGDRNHHRVATRLGKENVDALNILSALLPGVLLTYNGEEIGMENGEVTFEEGDDPNGCRNETTFNELSRDFARTPYHWDTTKNSGFSDSDKAWLPVSEKYLETNLVVESCDGVDSHYHVYQEVLKLKQLQPFKTGKIKVVAVSDNTLAYSRTLHGYDSYVVMINLGASSTEVVNITSVFNFNCDRLEVTRFSANSSFSNGLIYATDSFEISPHESVVARVIQKGNDDWWKHAVFYQVYPRSFKDSDGDGIGDLKGITSKLNHFVDAGVDAIWLSSVFKSGEVDAGVSDFRAIDDDYGIMEDFDEMLEEAHALGIKVIIDFIPNHSSDQHEWFLLSQNKTLGYEDYYVWKDPVDGEEPNNWLSLLKNSAWEFSDTRKQYYLHQFSKQQPDLNYRSKSLVQEITDIMLFWLDKGVDGFGIDTISYLYEDEEFRNEPLSGENVDANNYAYLSHIYTKDQPETFNMLYKFRVLVDNFTKYHGGDARVLIAMASSDTKNTLLCYGTDDGSTLGAHLALNLQLITKVDKDFTSENLIDVITEWFDYITSMKYTANWLLGDHNYHRVATRFGSENLDGFNMLVALLPGVQITYYGEEIGMENGEVTFDDGVDVGDCDDAACYDETSRDFERTPYHWDRSKNAGFSDGEHTWLPVSKKYLETNLADQSITGIKSHYLVYQDLVQLRGKEAFSSGELKLKAVSDKVVAFSRYLLDGDAYVFVFNFGSEEVTVDLVEEFGFGPSVQVLITSVNAALDSRVVYDAKDFSINAHESFVGIFTDQNPSTTTTETASKDDTSTSTATAAETTTMSPTLLPPAESSLGSHHSLTRFLLLLSTLTLLFNINLCSFFQLFSLSQ